LTEVRGHAAQVAGPILDVLRQRKIGYLFVAGLLMTAAHGALYVFYSIHLVAHGYGKTLVGLLWTLGVVAEIVVFLLMPRISMMVSMRWILLACFALAVLRFMLIGWTVEFVVLLVFAQLLHGASFGAHHAATMAALNRWFLPAQQARAQALYGSVAYGVGGMDGALLAGALWERVGPGMTFSAASLLALVGMILVWRGVPGDLADAGMR
jgi:PPP family 3-phenylpropionic acid transporter